MGEASGGVAGQRRVGGLVRGRARVRAEHAALVGIAALAAPVGLVRVVTPPPSAAVARARETAIEIEVADARVLVTSGFDRAALADVLAVLREARAS